MMNEGFDLANRRPDDEQGPEIVSCPDCFAEEPERPIPDLPVHQPENVFAIDLGGAYSRIARLDRAGLPEVIADPWTESIPSAILFECEDGVYVGEDAAELKYFEPQRVFSRWKEWLGCEHDPHAPVYEAFGRRYTPAELTTILLKKIAIYAEDSTGDPVRNVVISCPAWFDFRQRRLLAEAGKAAGLNVLDVISDPIAAALCYSTVMTEGKKRVMVLDLGDSFDAAVLDVSREDESIACKKIAIYGDDALGCPDWDEVLYRLLLWKYCEEWGYAEDSVAADLRLEIRMKTEDIRKKLSVREKVSCLFHSEAERTRLDVTRAEFEEATQYLVDRMIARVDSMLENAGLTDADIDKVLLVGGGVKMPMVHNAFTGRFGEKARLFEPEFSVVKGAAIYGNAMHSYQLPENAPPSGPKDGIIV